MFYDPQIMCRFFKSSLAMKFIMALTGIALIGFVIAHLLGNLQIFLGAEKLNHYGQTLVDLGGLLWIARISILVIFILHIYLGFRLKIMNKMARPESYANENTIQASLSSRSMIFTGLMILFFVIYHLLHYTFCKMNPEFLALTDDKGQHDIYRMLILGFSNKYVSATYIAAILMLATHLHHGASSMFQSLGLSNAQYKKYTRCVGPVLSIIVFVGYVSIPVAIILGILK